LLLILVVGMLLASILEPKFVTLRTQTLLASHLWELAIVAIPMLLIIMSGGIDLSVGAMVALCAVVLGLAFEQGATPFASTLLAVACGSALGAANGFFVAKARVHPLIVTLATMAAYRGIAEGISLGRPLSNYPESFQNLSQGKLVGIPIPALVFAAVVALAWFALARLRLGRWIVAIGSQETVARFSRIPISKVKILLYSAMGLLCGIAATLLVARNNTAKADMGLAMELEAITAVVLGGASIEGGKGKVLGVVLGLFVIHETREFISWHWRQSELTLIVIGALLIGTLFLEKLLQWSRPPTRKQS
jgi:rhamnose transport system permease protein